MSDHFWADAPHIPWTTWLYRFITKEEQSIQLLPISDTMKPDSIPTFKNGSEIIKPTQLHAGKASQYCIFLRDYFGTQLKIPIETMRTYIESNHWIGAEITTNSGKLLALAISKDCGQLNGIPIGCISWLCVHPDYRKKGLPNILLRAVYSFSTQLPIPRYAQIFRKEGFPPIIPHIMRESVYMRTPRKYGNRVHLREISGQSSSQHSKNKMVWILQSEKPDRECITFEYKINNLVYQMTLQPTYEIIDNEYSAEIVGWSSNQTDHNNYVFETMIDSLPFGTVYCSQPSLFLDSVGWKYMGSQGWYGFHIDPGFPLPTRIYPTVSI